MRACVATSTRRALMAEVVHLDAGWDLVIDKKPKRSHVGANGLAEEIEVAVSARLLGAGEGPACVGTARHIEF